jgi:hypothetical protein
MSDTVGSVIAADKAARRLRQGTVAEVDRWFDHASNRLPLYIAAIEALLALCDEVEQDPRRGRTHGGGLFPAILQTETIRRALAVLAPNKEQQ